MDPGANGASRPIEAHRREFPTLGDHGRWIRHDAAALAATVEDAADGLHRQLAAHVQGHPLRTLGLAAGVGYLLGGGLGSRLTILLLGAAARVIAASAAHELGSRNLPAGPDVAGHGAERSEPGGAKAPPTATSSNGRRV